MHDADGRRPFSLRRYFSHSSQLSVASWTTDETGALDPCGHCDNCTRPREALAPRDVTLATWQILKVVEAVRQTGTKLTLGQLVHPRPGLRGADHHEVPGLGVADAGRGVRGLQDPDQHLVHHVRGADQRDDLRQRLVRPGDVPRRRRRAGRPRRGARPHPVAHPDRGAGAEPHPDRGADDHSVAAPGDRLLVGYLHATFANGSGYVRMADVPDEWDFIHLAFGEPTSPTSGEIRFTRCPASECPGVESEAEFIAAIQEGRPAVPSFHDGARVQAVIEAIVASAAERRSVEVQSA